MIIVKNKKAYFEYTIVDNFTAGLQLKGSEVKAIKNGDVNITEAYCYIFNNEIFIKNMHVSEHKQGGKHNNHEPLRERKLLLTKKEINNLSEKVKQVGFTIVPLSIILSPTGYVKLEIGLAKGKKLFDKKESIRLKDLNMDLKKTLKANNI
jgi:SsrA-binding protein